MDSTFHCYEERVGGEDGTGGKRRVRSMERVVRRLFSIFLNEKFWQGREWRWYDWVWGENWNKWGEFE